MHSRKPCMWLSGAFSVIEEEDRVEWKDGKCRCCWANPKNERYIRYHDEEWGRPVHGDSSTYFQRITHNSRIFFQFLKLPLPIPADRFQLKLIKCLFEGLSLI